MNLVLLKNLQLQSVGINKFMPVHIASIYLGSAFLEFFIAGT